MQFDRRNNSNRRKTATSHFKNSTTRKKKKNHRRQIVDTNLQFQNPKNLGENIRSVTRTYYLREWEERTWMRNSGEWDSSVSQIRERKTRRKFRTPFKRVRLVSLYYRFFFYNRRRIWLRLVHVKTTNHNLPCHHSMQIIDHYLHMWNFSFGWVK